MTEAFLIYGPTMYKVGSYHRVYGRLRSHTLEELAEFWKVRSEYDRPMEQAVTWADVKSRIVVKGWRLLPLLGPEYLRIIAHVLCDFCAAHFLPHLRVR